MAREMRHSGISWIGMIPSNWETHKNKALFYEVNERCEDGSKYTLLSVSEYTGVTPRSTIIKDGEYETHAETLDGYKICHVGDIVMNIMLAWKRATAASAYDGIISPAYCVFRGRDVNTKYFHYLFRTDNCAEMFKRYSTGIIDSRLRLYPDVFLSLKSIVPPLSEQNQIAAFLDTECNRIDAVIENTRASIDEYRKLKQAIITQAVTKGIHAGRSMKDSGIEWIGDIPADWQILSLGTVTESMRNGYVGPTKDLFIDDGVRYIQSLHIKDGRIDFSRYEYYVSEEWANIHPKIKENDILIVQTGDIGNVGLVTAEYDGCNCHALIIATPRTDLVYPEYLTYYLRSVVGKELLLYYKTGALLPHLNSGKIKFASVCVPTIQEQIDITTYLNIEVTKIDELMLKKELLLDELESYKKALIFEYVTGKKEVV